MKPERQIFCGICGATQLTKFCTAGKNEEERTEWHKSQPTYRPTPIENCTLRLVLKSKVEQERTS